MRIAVVGAAGRTGRHVVEQALGRGMGVIAVARDPERLGLADQNLVLRAADVRDGAAVLGALEGAQAVISALGTGSSRAPTDVYSRGVANEMEAMRAHGIERLAAISAAPAGPRAEQPFLARRLVMPALERFFGNLYADMRRMEALLGRCEDLNWVALRPPRLIDKPATGSYRADASPLPRARTLTYPDLATALLDCFDGAESRGGVRSELTSCWRRPRVASSGPASRLRGGCRRPSAPALGSVCARAVALLRPRRPLLPLPWPDCVE